MTDDPNLEPGRSFDIATDGVGSGRPITVATRGFIVPIIGDLIISGEAGVVFNQFKVIGDGGIIVNGAAQFKRTIVYAASGGIIVNGKADVDTTGKLKTAHGGAMNRPAWRWNQRPTITWEPADPQIELSPTDYLKRIQQKIKQRRPKTFNHKSDGTLKVNGRGKIIAVHRSLPDGPIVFADSAPLKLIDMNISSLFSQGNTAKEIAEFEDQLILSDLLGQGQYRIKTGAKARFVHRKTKGPKGAAAVTFKSASANAEHTDFVAELIKSEDEELVLGDDVRETWAHEEEELKLLGLID